MPPSRSCFIGATKKDKSDDQKDTLFCRDWGKGAVLSVTKTGYQQKKKGLSCMLKGRSRQALPLALLIIGILEELLQME